MQSWEFREVVLGGMFKLVVKAKRVGTRESAWKCLPDFRAGRQGQRAGWQEIDHQGF